MDDDFTISLNRRPSSAGLIETSKSYIIDNSTYKNTELFPSHSPRLNEYSLGESFTSKRSPSSISYKKPAKHELSSTGTPRYKIEMYAPDYDRPLIKGSVYNTTQSILSASRWKRNSNKLNLSSSLNLSPERTVSPSRGILRETSYDDLDLSALSLNNTNFYGLRTSSIIETSPEYKRLQKQDELIAEEQVYLKFVEEITADVLTRGIFSDRVLNQVFETHIERRKDDLNEGRMRELIEELKNDLAIHDDKNL